MPVGCLLFEHQAQRQRSGTLLNYSYHPVQQALWRVVPGGREGGIQWPSQCQAGQTLPDKPRAFRTSDEKRSQVAWLSYLSGPAAPPAPG